jgi:hypothetical protein
LTQCKCQWLIRIEIVEHKFVFKQLALYCRQNKIHTKINSLPGTKQGISTSFDNFFSRNIGVSQPESTSQLKQINEILPCRSNSTGVYLDISTFQTYIQLRWFSLMLFSNFQSFYNNTEMFLEHKIFELNTGQEKNFLSFEPSLYADTQSSIEWSVMFDNSLILWMPRKWRVQYLNWNAKFTTDIISN